MKIDNLRDLSECPNDFARLYVKESLLLAEVVGDADCFLKSELIATAKQLWK